ncbi:MAG: SpoIIE family protein phosphatase [Cellvibrionales bacterium]|nr:SpoIIE family protein phosphatase [Cellvibrionales bacterium]
MVFPPILAGIILIALVNVRSVIDYRINEAYLDAKAGAALMVNRIATQKRSIEEAINSVADSLQTFQESHKDLQSLLAHMILSNPEISGASFIMTKEYRAITKVPMCEPEDHDKPISWPANCYFADHYFQVGDKLQYFDLTTLEPDYIKHPTYKLVEDMQRKNRKMGWSPLHASLVNGVKIFSYIIPIETVVMGNKVILAYLVADLELSKLLPMITVKTPTEGDPVVRLVSNNNEVLIDSTNRREYSFNDELNSIPKEAKEKLEQAIAEKKPFQMQLPCLCGQQRCYYLYTKISDEGAGLLYVYHLENIYHGIEAFALQYVVLSALLLLVGLLILWYLCKRAMAPLHDLSHAAIAIGEGNFQQQLPAVKYNDEVGEMVTAFRAMQTALATHTEQLNRETAKRHRLEGEMYAASVIQKALLIGGGHVSQTVNQLSIWAEVKSARAIGGDFYHFELLENNRLIFILGDVSDKGVSAALFMTRVLSIFRFEIHQHQAIGDILHAMNNELLMRNDESMFVTLVCGELSLDTWQLDYISAGHDLPMIVKAESVADLNGVISPALGLRDIERFALNTYTLLEGDKLILYTDGISEAFSAEDEIYGDDRLAKVLDKSKAERANIIGENVLKSVRGFSNKTVRADDMAIMVLGIEPIYQFLIPVTSESFETYHYRYDAQMDEVKRCLADTAELARVFDVGNKLYGMQLVAEEILMNWIQHADHDLKDKIEFIWLKSLESVILEVVDQSSAFNPLGMESETYGDIGGLGIQFIQSVTAEQRYLRENDTNRLCLSFN